MEEFVDPDRGDWQQAQADEQRQREEEQKMEGRKGLVISANSGGDYELPPTGMQVARCVSIVDLGTHKGDYKGKSWSRRKGYLQFELMGKDRMEDGRRFSVTQRYTLSLHENAQLFQHLRSWRGRAFTPAELEAFDLRNCLGKACMLNLVPSDDGKYVNIDAITPLPEGVLAPQPENKLVFFSLDEFDPAVFEHLSERTKELIRLSPEYQKFASGTANTPSVAGIDSDIPF